MGVLASMKKDISYSTYLDQRLPQTYQEFLTRAHGFINVEKAKKALKSKVVAPTKEEAGQPSNQNNDKKRRGNSQVQVEQKHNPAPTTHNRGNNAPTNPGDAKGFKPQRYDTYTPLTKDIEDVIHEISHL